MTDHVHRWRIDTPNGLTSKGACCCGTERQFVNVYVADLDTPIRELQDMLSVAKRASRLARKSLVSYKMHRAS